MNLKSINTVSVSLPLWLAPDLDKVGLLTLLSGVITIGKLFCTYKVFHFGSLSYILRGSFRLNTEESSVDLHFRKRHKISSVSINTTIWLPYTSASNAAVANLIKHFRIVIYDSRVVLARKLPILRLWGRNLRL